jgi:hypothetical protein
MLHIYASVSGVFIRILQVLSSRCCNILQWIHTCFQVFLCFASVSNSDVCCKYFIWMFHMWNETHLLQPPATAAGAQPSGRPRVVGQCRHRGPVWARKTSRRGKLGVGKRTSRRECPNARARLNVRALFVSEKSKNIKFN